MGKKYKVTAEAAIKKEKKDSAKTITTVKSGVTLLIESTGSGWAKIASDQKKINNKTIANFYIKTKYIKVVSSSSGNNKKDSKNKKHPDHMTLNAKGTIAKNAYIDFSCSKSTTNGIYFPKGSKVTVKKYCSANLKYYVSGKTNNGKQTSAWIPSLTVNISKSDNKNLMNKLKKAAGKGSKSAKKKLAQLKKSNKSHTRKQRQTVYGDLTSLAKFNTSAFDTSAYAESLMVQNAQGIHGIPYQFLPSVDYRLTNKVSFGRKYAERIVMKMPLVLFSPGKPDFAASFSKKDRKNIIQGLIHNTVGKGLKSKTLNKLLKTEGRYYTFSFEYADYYKYVDKSLRYCAIMLGIGGVTHATYGYVKTQSTVSNNWGSMGSSGKPKKKKKQKLKSFRWANFVNNKLKGFINSNEYVAFYVDSETSISESFDNTTSTSSIAESVNGASELSKEIQFLMGPVAGVKIDALTTDSFEASYDKVKDIADKYLGGSKLIKRLGEMFTTIGKGGKLVFPELWGDSSYSKNYNLSIKLRTPDGDKISWYLNILVPLIHLLALAAPHSMGPNGYSSPYLVRVFYKGIFNCDMGLITNIDIAKGKEGAWTVDGLPTEVDVTIQLKDLYSMFAMTGGGKSLKKDVNFFNNTALLDYLCSSCGININKIEASRQLEAYAAFAKNKFTDLFPNMWLGFNNSASRLANDVYTKVVKSGSK